jgi:hypothetical protein
MRTLIGLCSMRSGGVYLAAYNSEFTAFMAKTIGSDDGEA